MMMILLSIYKSQGRAPGRPAAAGGRGPAGAQRRRAINWWYYDYGYELVCWGMLQLHELKVVNDIVELT